MNGTRHPRREHAAPHRFETAEDRLDVYRRVTRHERSLWSMTVAVVAVSAATIALLTLGSVMHGAFRYPLAGTILAGGSFVLLVLFVAYVMRQRKTFESNRNRIFRELESRSDQLAQSNGALQEALRTQDVFLNTVSHELKTPLTCILAYAEFLADQDLDREEVGTHARAITDEGRSLMRLIEQLVDVTRFRSGPVNLECETIDINGVLSGVVERSEAAARDRGLVLEAVLHARSLPVRLDMERMPGLLEDFLRDLCGGCPPGSRILVRSRPVDEGWAELAVEAGRETPAPRRGSAIFRPFAALNPRPEGRSGDLGLTLPLLKRYVTAHGGTLQVTEEEDRFELSAALPLAAPPAVAEAA